MSNETDKLGKKLVAAEERERAAAAALAATPILERTDSETEVKRQLIKQLLTELSSKEPNTKAKTDDNKRSFFTIVREILNRIEAGQMEIVNNQRGYGFFQSGKKETEPTLTYWNPNTLTTAPESGLTETKPQPRTLTLKTKIAPALYGSNLVIFTFDFGENEITVIQPDSRAVFK